MDRATLYAEAFDATSESLRDLLTDVMRLDRGWKIIYAVDFSEVYEFIRNNLRPPSDHIWERFAKEERSALRSKYRLGMLHLFQSIGSNEGLYLLPPHVEELVVHSRYLRGRPEAAEELREEVRAILADDLLDEEARKALAGPLGERAGNKDALDPAERRAVKYIRSRFARLCERLSRFIELDEQGDPFSSLSRLLREETVVLDPGKWIGEEAVNSIYAEVDHNAVMHVLNCFPKRVIRAHPAQKYRDAAALIYLGKLNDVLKKQKRLMLFVSRDANLKLAAQAMYEKTGQPNMSEYFRTMETVFYSLLTQSEEERKRSEFAQTLASQWEGLPKDAHSIAEHKGARFSSTAAHLLRKTLDTWNEVTNVRLALTSAKVQWLHDTLEAPSAEYRAVPKQEEDMLLLARLRRFLIDDKFVRLGSRDAFGVWTQLTDARARVAFLGTSLTPEAVSRIAGIAARGEDDNDVRNWLRNSDKYTSVFSLGFHGKAYSGAMERLRHWRDTSEPIGEFGKLTGALDEAISEAISGLASAEKFLFMALVLAVLDFWRLARDFGKRAIEKARKEGDADAEREAHYFLAIAGRRIAEENPDEAFESYVEAFQEIVATCGTEVGQLFESQDYRIQLEGATICLELEDEAARVDRQEAFKTLIVSLGYQFDKELVEAALESLIDAKNMAEDSFHQVRIANVLAYYLALHAGASAAVEEADRDLCELVALTSQGRAVRRTNVWPTIEHTMCICHLRLAWDEGSREKLQMGLLRLEAIKAKGPDSRLQILIETQMRRIQEAVERKAVGRGRFVNMLRGVR